MLFSELLNMINIK